MISDSQKGKLGCASAFAGILLPVVGFALGYFVQGWQTGLWIALGLFALCWIISAVSFLTIKDPSWYHIMAPFFTGVAYNILPDAVPFALDDVTTLFLGSLVTLYLTYKKHGTFPWKMILPLGIATVYPIIGEFIPTRIDELLVNIVTILSILGPILGWNISSFTSSTPNSKARSSKVHASRKGSIIDVEATEVFSSEDKE